MSNPRGSLREVMPVAAELVDWLRGQLGREYADRLVLEGKQGRGGFYVAEIGPDGVFREFGSTSSGTRAQLLEGKVVRKSVQAPGAAGFSKDEEPGIIHT